MLVCLLSILGKINLLSGNVCPSPPDGPAGDLQPTATLVHPGINFTGECLGVGLSDDEVMLKDASELLGCVTQTKVHVCVQKIEKYSSIHERSDADVTTGFFLKILTIILT